MNLGYTDWLWPLSAVFALGLVLALWTLLWRDRRDLKILGHQNLVLSPGLAWSRRMLKGFLVLGGFLLMLLGALRLQGKPVPEDVILRGSDVVVVLDVSKSMLTQDLVPNRLEAAKKAVSGVQIRATSASSRRPGLDRTGIKSSSGRRGGNVWHGCQRGSSLTPISASSTARAHWRPSRMAHTTRLCPRRMSPHEKTFSVLVR